MRAALVVAVFLVACTSTPLVTAPVPREPTDLPELLPDESRIVAALTAAGRPPTLIAGSKLETFFGSTLPARFFRTAAGTLEIVWTKGMPPLVACFAPAGARVVHAITPRGLPTREIDAGIELTIAVFHDAFVVARDAALIHAVETVFGPGDMEAPCALDGETFAPFGPRVATVPCGERAGMKLAISFDPPREIGAGAWMFTGCVLADFALKTARVAVELGDGERAIRLIARDVPRGELVPFELTLRVRPLVSPAPKLFFLDGS